MAIDEAGRLIVPREIALLVRRGLLLQQPRLDVPALPVPGDHQTNAADRQAGHAADQFLRDVDRVIAYLSRGALGRQSNGAFSLRDWDRAVTTTGLPASATEPDPGPGVDRGVGRLG